MDLVHFGKKIFYIVLDNIKYLLVWSFFHMYNMMNYPLATKWGSSYCQLSFFILGVTGYSFLLGRALSCTLIRSLPVEYGHQEISLVCHIFIGPVFSVKCINVFVRMSEINCYYACKKRFIFWGILIPFLLFRKTIYLLLKQFSYVFWVFYSSLVRSQTRQFSESIINVTRNTDTTPTT